MDGVPPGTGGVSASRKTQRTYQSPATPFARIDCLTGLRGVAILLVVFTHLSRTGTSPLADSWWRATSGLGVQCFFVLTGFLTTPCHAMVE